MFLLANKAIRVIKEVRITKARESPSAAKVAFIPRVCSQLLLKKVNSEAKDGVKLVVSKFSKNKSEYIKCSPAKPFAKRLIITVLFGNLGHAMIIAARSGVKIKYKSEKKSIYYPFIVIL